MRKLFVAAMSAFCLMTVSCKNNESNDNANSADTGLENTSSNVDKAVGDTMPLEVATGMDTTDVGGRAQVGAASDNDTTNTSGQ